MKDPDQQALATQGGFDEATAIQWRAGSLPVSFVQANPITSARLITGLTDNASFHYAAASLEGSWPWLKAMHGQDGTLLAARALALRQKDPGLRTDLNAAIDRASGIENPSLYKPIPQESFGLKPDQGNVDAARHLLLVAQNFYDLPRVNLRNAIIAQQVGFGVSPDVAANLADDVMSFHQLDEKQVQEAVATGPSPEESVLLFKAKDEGFGKTSLAQLASQFGQVANPTHPEALAGYTQVLTSALSAPFDAASTVAGDVAKVGGGGALLGASALLGATHLTGAADALHREAGRLGGQVDTGIHAAMSGVNTGFGRATDILSATALALAGAPAKAYLELTGGHDSKSFIQPFIHPAQYLWPTQAGSGAGLALADMWGVKPTSPYYDSIVSLGSVAAQLAVGKFAIAEPFAGFREAQRVPFVDGADYKRFGPIGGAVRSFFGKDFESWADSRSGQAFAKTVMKEIEKNPEASVGAIDQAFRRAGMSPGMASLIADAKTPAEVLDTWRKRAGGYSPEDRATDFARVKELEAQRADLAAKSKAALGARGPVEPGQIGTLTPLEQVTRRAGQPYYIQDMGGITDKVYHQTDIRGALDVLERQPNGGLASRNELYFSNNPDLALGQGGNQGVTMEFDAGGLQGRVSTTKPGWDFQYEQGNAEIQGVFNDGAKYFDNLRSVTVDKSALEIPKGGWKSDAVRLNTALDGLESQGWIKEDLGDKIRLTRPGDEPGVVDPSTISQVEAEIAVLNKRLNTVVEPTWEFPSTSAARRVARGVALTRVGDDMTWLLNPTGNIASHLPLPHIIRLFDQMFDSKLFDPTTPTSPPNALSLNSDYLLEKGRRAGIDPKTLTKLISEQVEVAGNPVEWERWASRVQKEFHDSPSIAPDRKQNFGLYSNSAPGERFRGMLDSKSRDAWDNEIDDSRAVLSENVVIDGKVTPQPLLDDPVQSLDGFRLPSVGSIIDSSSWTRKQIRKLKKVGPAVGLKGKVVHPVGETIALPYTAAKFISDASTAILKPIVLTAGGLRTVPLLMRIEGEQALRMKMYGYNSFFGNLPKFRPEEFDLFKLSDLHPRDLGSLVAADFSSPGVKQEFQRIPLRSRTGPPDDAWKALAYRLREAFRSEPTRQLINLGPEAWTEWLDGEGAQYKEFYQRQVDRSTTPDILSFAKDKYQSLRELAGGNEALFDAMTGGHWYYRGDLLEQDITNRLKHAKAREQIEGTFTRGTRAQPAIPGVGDTIEYETGFPPKTLQHEVVRIQKDPVTGQDVPIVRLGNGNEWPVPEWYDNGRVVAPRMSAKLKSEIADEYSRLLSDDGVLRQSIRDARANGDTTTLAALQEQHRSTFHRLEEIEQATLGRPDKTIGVHFDKPGHLERSLEDAYRAGDYQLPHSVSAPIDRLKPGYSPELNDIKFLDVLNRKLYAPFGVVGAVDRRLTRGPLYQQIATESYKDLIARGYTKTDAVAWAKVHASQVTKDIMFDLGTKSSTHMFLKNAFWFAPAFQEALVTWGVKIPSRYYWPLGAAYMYNRAHLVNEAMHTLGFIHKGEDGKDQITVPGMDKLMEKLGVPGVLKPFASIDPKSLNLVTAGGLAPPLSFQSNVALGEAAKQYGGIFRALSQALQVRQESAIGAPALDQAWEALTGDLPPWAQLIHGDYAKFLFDNASKNALSTAYAVNADKEPRPDEFYARFPKTEDGRSGAEAQFRTAHEKWTKKVIHDADHFVRVHALMKLLGSTMSPGSFNVSSDAQVDADKVKTALYGPPLPGESDNAAYARGQKAVQDYLDRYPHADGFLVPKTIAQDPVRTLPFNPKDDELWAKLYTGERRALTADEFIGRLTVGESYRFYQQQQGALLQTIGPTVADRLFHYGQVKEVLSDVSDRWNAYKSMNPEASAWLATKTSAPTDNPALEYSQQLESELKVYSGLKSLSDIFTTDGRRSGDYRKVLATIGQDLGEQGKGKFRPARNQEEADLQWYFDKVMRPYSNKVAPLYDEATRLLNSGLDAGGVFTQIANIKQQYSKGVTRDGQKYPTPDEFSWGNLTTGEQGDRVRRWASQPATWLSEFELDKAGYKVDKETKGFLKQLAAYDEAFNQANLGADTGSNAYQQADQQRLATIYAAAKKVSPQALTLAGLEEATPIQRMLYLGTQKGAPRPLRELADSFPTSLVKAVDYTSQAISKAGFKPSSWAQSVWDIKLWLYHGVDAMRDPQSKAYDSGFAKAMTNLSYSLPARGQDFRDGASLYDALFFGAFNSHIPPAVQQQLLGEGLITPAVSTATGSKQLMSMVSWARGQIGDPYVWGAEGPNSFDCSGLVDFAFNSAGVKIPRLTADGYMRSGIFNPIPIDQLKPGDILFYNFGRLGQGHADHVNIYIGNGQVISADHPGAPVRIEPVNWNALISTGRYVGGY